MGHEVWLSLKRSFQCKPRPSEIHDPNKDKQQRNAQRKDNNLNPITHEIVVDASNGQVRFCPCCPFPQSKSMEGPNKSKRPSKPSRETHFHVDAHNECNMSSRPNIPQRALLQIDNSNDPSILSCEKCGEKLKKLDANEAHSISAHSVIELHEEDSSWKIIETICQTSSIKPESKSSSWKIERVLKVQNTHKAFSSFEEQREVIKMNAEKLQKNKHPRCLADGNELLRFHGTTVSCSLGLNGSSSLCSLGHCGICQILRNGFSCTTTTKEFHGELGVFTTSTGAKAFESIGSMSDERSRGTRKCVVVCRVIAGRVRSHLEEIQEMDDLGFDSLARNISCHSDFEELYVLNPKAILPCFVAIYKS
ncbi:PolyADP-ribose polymerase [Senna tora]|uniref:PolyADP-ribose polymerase n=1 Tax=Senna tora TaxID=362788 RepID=A0A834WH26_9FABA|nr:PolyADP-ribose polymerase [Senna tora]